MNCCFGIFLLISLAHTTIAAGTAVTEPGQISSKSSRTAPEKNNSRQWAQWILAQVHSLPSLQAMEYGTLAASEHRYAMQKPLFNPQLGAFYTDKDDEEYGLVISQTIDWFDKRSANTRLGQVDYELLVLKKLLATENKLSEAILAYIEYSMSRQLLDVSIKQEKLLIKLSADLKLREATGDVGQIDAEMAYLSLSQSLQQISLIEIRYRKAFANLQQSLNSSEIPAHPESSIWINDIAQSDISKQRELKIQYAKKLLEQSVSQSKIALLNKKVNPTIGLGAGRDGSEDTILFEISVPLNVRNSFSSEYSSALHKVNQSEFELKEEQRLLKNDIEQSRINYQQLNHRVLGWQKLTRSRLKNSQKLLNKQWQSGDISTSDYLFSLKQRTDTLIVNIELNAEMHKAWVEWLLASSQVQQWLKRL
ncbi:MAG: TolC family protein [Gammaproteobacteria bacterium]|nr:TolC family protein [Gammaproteobacteria bacterium]